MNKPIIKYTKGTPPYKVGMSGCICPINHPREELNHRLTVTLKAEKVQGDTFETHNHIYMREAA